MPILIMALLALIMFGCIGILLVVAVMMEHSTAQHPARHNRPHSENPDVAAPAGLNFDRPHRQGSPTEDHFPEDQSSKEKVNEHALVG